MAHKFDGTSNFIELTKEQLADVRDPSLHMPPPQPRLRVSTICSEGDKQIVYFWPVREAEPISQDEIDMAIARYLRGER